MKTGIYWQDPKYAVGRCRNDPGCVLYLPLHRLDGASFISKDAYGHLCTVTGALWRPDGRYFDGVDDYIDCGVDASLKIATGTIEAWAKINDITKNVYMRLVSKKEGDWPTDGYDLNLNPSAGVIGFLGSDANAAEAPFTAATGWHRYAVIFSGGTAQIYLDGVALTMSDSSYGTSLATDKALVIGIQLQGLVYEWEGLIGEVRIYNRALTPLEIQHSYLASKWRYR